MYPKCPTVEKKKSVLEGAGLWLYLSTGRDSGPLCIILWVEDQSMFPLWGWGEEMDEIQLEVSEWTLPGPSVGDVTDEGVGASCQPPFVLMPCGLYIWLAARLSLYPPVWLITWRRVSTWD